MSKWILAIIVSFISFVTLAAEVVQINDSRFTDATAKSGHRSFDTFSAAGLYLLEEFDPSKPIVVMVHGANGHPGNFQELAAEAQSRGAQVWLPYYPTGVALSDAGDFVSNQVVKTAATYGAVSVSVIAHSMGGLVATHAVERIKAYGVNVKQLTTVASPLGGHGAARLGVWFSPNPQANWIDLAPGSQFLNEMHAAKLSTAFVLFAVTRDLQQETDGTISLRSQMNPDMARKANQIHQLTESHVGVLTNPETVRAIVDASV